jgi:hypothetical protein
MTALHPHILAARNDYNVQRYHLKRAYHARSLAGIPDHRTDAERLAYSRMMARRVTPSSTRYQRAMAAYLKRHYG